jgi:hypothetical protein
MQSDIAKMKEHRKAQQQQLEELKQEKVKLRHMLDTADSSRTSHNPAPTRTSRTPSLTPPASRGGGSMSGGGGRGDRDRESGAGGRSGGAGVSRGGDRETGGRGTGGAGGRPSPPRPPHARHHHHSENPADARAGMDERDRHAREGPRDAWYPGPRDARHDRLPQGSPGGLSRGGAPGLSRGGAAVPGARNSDGGHVQPPGAKYVAPADDDGDM